MQDDTIAFPRRWVFASRNKHKMKEIAKLLPDFMEVIGLDDIGCHEELPETHETLEENSLEKAVYVREKYGYACFSEDSGLEIAALGGRPGVHSAHYSGSRDAFENIQVVLHQMRGEVDRTAQFKTVFTLAGPGFVEQFTGMAPGNIIEKPRGNGGFGYDPIFQPLGYDQTFAEMPLETKQLLSHRSKAFENMLTFIKATFVTR